MRSIETLLVANRGEIAVRVMKTAKALGMRTVAVYSDADTDALHVRAADQAVRLGPAPVSESYLRADLVLAAALETGADAIHPGYGFLSENADFAEAVSRAGLVFVGPSSTAIDIMGDKARAKRAMLAAGVPCVPGYQGEDQSDTTLINQAGEIGFPLMVKAAAGGGGRGMRLVEAADSLPEAIELARSEAENAFGSRALILERAIVAARHVEFQIFADDHGAVIHLNERDCSVQRRHQKVIEEAPCPVMTPDVRASMGQAAIEAARAVDYRGAGTVEFLLDASGAYYFLEMNTRLQVEHPVTEAITGLDLVALQLRVAAGQRLGLAQEEVRLDGHAMEVRLYAEDPENEFLPSTGPITLFQTPAVPGLRVDSGVGTGGEVSPFYDAMLAKVITHGADREEARRMMVAALQGTALFGPKTNRDFLLQALQKSEFKAGEATTSFISDVFGDDGVGLKSPASEDKAVAAVAMYLHRRQQAQNAALDLQDELLDWASDGGIGSVFVTGDFGETMEVRAEGQGAYRVIESAGAGETGQGSSSHVVQIRTDLDGRQSYAVDGVGLGAVTYAEGEAILHIATARRTFVLQDRVRASEGEEDAGSGGRVVAPMHGKLLSIDVTQDATVEKGQRLAVLEAMKMQHEILSEISGRVKEITAHPNTQIAAEDVILLIDPDD